MQYVMGAYGTLLGYLIKTSLGGVMCLFVAGFLAGLGVSGLIKRRTPCAPDGEENTERRQWGTIVTFSLSFALLALGLACGGTDMGVHYWPVLLIGFAVGFFLRVCPVTTSGTVGLLGITVLILLSMLLWTFHAFTGKTAVLEVTVQSVRERAGGRIVTLLVKHPEQKDPDVYTVRGTKWGVNANVAQMNNWVVFLGGKTYYRLNGVVGLQGAALDRQIFHTTTQPAWDNIWEVLEVREDRIPGVRSVYEDIQLKTAVPGRAYRVFVDNDGGMVIELISG